MKKYKLQHVYNTEIKEYRDYYYLVDVVNSMSADRFAKNLRHAIALSIFDSGYRFGRDFEELRRVVCIERLKEEYYRIKMKSDRHLISTDICGFDFQVINEKDESHYTTIHLSVQVIDKQLKFVVTYCCDLPDGEEIKTTNLDELYNRVYDWKNAQIREVRQRREQLAADLAVMGVLPKLKADKKSKTNQMTNMMLDIMSAN